MNSKWGPQDWEHDALMGKAELDPSIPTLDEYTEAMNPSPVLVPLIEPKPAQKRNWRPIRIGISALVFLLLCVLTPPSGRKNSHGPAERIPNPVATAEAATITVCASGCDYTNSQLQTALNAATCNTEILLQSGFTYTAPSSGYIMGDKCASPTWDSITIRTGVTSTGTIVSLSSFPAAGKRVTATDAVPFAKMIPSVNNEAAIRSVLPGETTAGICSGQPCLGSGWTIKWLEFSPKIDWAQKALVRLGSFKAGKELQNGVWVSVAPNGETQDTVAKTPRYLSLIQCYVHGDPIIGQHQGVLISSRETRIYHNLITNIKSLAETQALTFLGALGPIDVKNNELDATGENIISGGGDPFYRLSATVSGSPTTTSITLSSPVYNHLDGTTEPANLAVDMYTNIFISVTHAGIDYGGVTCALSGSTCTLNPALPVVPSVGDTVKWSLVMGGLTFQYNYLHKDPNWINPVAPTPTGVSVKAGTGGSLAAATYCYAIQNQLFVSAADPYANSDPSTEQCVAVGASGTATVSWTAYTNADQYRVWGRTSGGQNMYWDIPAGTTTFTDTGSAGTTGTIPAHGTFWVVKNNFELKHCDGASPQGPCLIEGNIIDWSWCCSQSNIVSIKTNNQNGKDYSATIRNLSFVRNWVKHANRAIALTCTSTGNSSPPGQAPSGPMTDVTISHNIFSDLQNTYYNYGGVGAGQSPDPYNSAIAISSGSYANEVPGRRCERITFSHNTFLAETDDLKGPIQINLNQATDTVRSLVIKDNILARECQTSGCVTNQTQRLKTFNPNNAGQGQVAWVAGADTATSSTTNNLWTSGTQSTSTSTYTTTYFPNSFFITDAVLKSTHLANYAACTDGSSILGCALLGTSSLKLAASDGTDVGANILSIQAFTDIALSGDLSGGGGGGGGVAAVPQFTAAGNGGNASASSVTTGTITPTGTNRYLYCALAVQNLAITVSSVTFGAATMTSPTPAVSFDNGTGSAAKVWYYELVNPSSVGNVVTVNLSAATAVAVGCSAYSSVDQTTPHGLFFSNGSNSNQPNVTVTSADTELVVDAVSVRVGTTTLTAGSGQTQRVQKQSAAGLGNVTVLTSDEPGVTGTSALMSWDVDDTTAKSWAAIGTSLKGSTGTGGGAGTTSHGLRLKIKIIR